MSSLAASLTIADFSKISGEASFASAGTWNGAGDIVFSLAMVRQGLFRVAASGGEVVALTRPNESRGETAHAFPQFLPDGRHFLFAIRRGSSEYDVYIGALDSAESKRVVTGAANVSYAAPGYLVFVREGVLLAQVFDPKQLALVGEPVTLADDVQSAASVIAGFSVSQTGLLVYEPSGGFVGSQLTWLDRAGKELGSVGEPGVYQTMQLSPDEQRLGVGRMDPRTRATNIWVIDLQRGVASRVTSGSERESNPAWSPDGRRIAFNSTRKGVKSLYDMASAGGDETLLLQATSSPLSVSDRSKDGRFLLYNHAATRELWALPLVGDRTPIRVVRASAGRSDQPNFSPDGKWVAYNAEESGSNQVYVTLFPPTGEKWQLSSAGGVQPRWRGDGRELFYLALDGTMMAVDLKMEPDVQPGTPRVLFKTNLTPQGLAEQFAVTRDGQRFLIMKPLADASAASLTVVLNWPTALRPLSDK